MKEFTRALPTEVEVMGRTVEGVALTWNKPYRVTDDLDKEPGQRRYYAEGWRPQSFVRGLKATGNVFESRVDHLDADRVGRTSFHESEIGLVFQTSMDETPAGDRALEKAKASRFRGVSLRYLSSQQRRGADGVIWRSEGTPRELSFIDQANPQYEDAVITGVRALAGDDPDELEETLAEGKAIAELVDRTKANLAIDLSTIG